MKGLTIAFTEGSVKLGWVGHSPRTFKLPQQVSKVELENFNKKRGTIRYVAQGVQGGQFVVSIHIWEHPEKVVIHVYMSEWPSNQLQRSYSTEFQK